MRKLFSQLLNKRIKNDSRVYLLLGGVGYGLYKPDKERIINCEASEQAMVDIAVGLAVAGKIPFVYGITPHLYRAFEGIRIYLNHYKIPVKLVGVGRKRDYTTLGFTHWAEDLEQVLDCFPNIVRHFPETELEVEAILDRVLESGKPDFISLPR